METASSETTRTDRNGCLERTLDATNCTQMDSEILCAMRSNSVMKSKIPEGSVACLGSLSAPLSLPSSGGFGVSTLVSAKNEEGSAASKTETASTMPMSSSSERWASCAASNSSCAMPSDTENARSEPREPRAPAVAIPVGKAVLPESAAQPYGPRFSMATSEVQRVSREGFLMNPALAYQHDSVLPVRRLLISPLVVTKVQGRGGKATRMRRGNTHIHLYSGSCFGCLLGSLLDFLREPDSRTSEMLVKMNKVLRPAGLDIMTCSGSDAELLQNGFACHHAIRGQLGYLPESKTSKRIDAKYGKKSVVLGISACVYFVLSYICRKLRNFSVTSTLAADWTKRILLHVSIWRSHREMAGDPEYDALHAERRALERGVIGLQRGKLRSEKEGLNTLESIQFELQHMRKAMWPAGQYIAADSQSKLIAWIKSDDFYENLDSREMQKPRRPNLSFPLSALPSLPSMWEGSDAGSSVSSLSSWSTLSSKTSISSVVSDCDGEEGMQE